MEYQFLSYLVRGLRWSFRRNYDSFCLKEKHLGGYNIVENRHQRLSNGRKDLCDDTNFIVLHVPDDGKNMQLVRPSDNPAHHDAIIKSGYHVLSHVWGNINDYPKWDVSAFITDVDGQPSKPVPMRPEKRNTLLALLKANPGYWWIDVMCARVDTPLVIMGSIYRYCDTCHVMVDCSPDLIADLAKSRLAQFDHALAPLSRDANEQDVVCLEISKANRSRQKKWTSYKHQKILTKLHNIINMFQPEFNCMQQLLDSKWFNRLWTLQEVALPTEKVRLISEQCDPDNLIQFDYNVVDSVSQKIFYVSSSSTLSLDPEITKQVIGRSGAHQLQDSASDLFCNKVGMLSNDRTPAQDYLKCLLTPNHPLKAVCLRAVLSVFASSSRKCYMPEDYVYGIIGLLSLDIPRMQDPQLVWEAFLQELESLLIQLSEDESQGLTYFSISKKAKTFQLCNAKDMADVYSGVAVMEVNDWNIFMFNMLAVYQRERTDKDFPPEYVAGFIKDHYRNGTMFNYRASKTRFYI